MHFFPLLLFLPPLTFEDIYCVVNQNCGNRKFYDAIESYILLLFFGWMRKFFSAHTIKIGNDDINGALERMAEDLTNFFPTHSHAEHAGDAAGKAGKFQVFGCLSFRCSRRESFSFNSERSFPTVEKFQLISSECCREVVHHQLAVFRVAWSEWRVFIVQIAGETTMENNKKWIFFSFV